MSSEIKDRQVREKLIHQGAEALTDAELLSVLMGRSEGEVASIETAEQLLESFGGSLSQIGRCTINELRMRCNMGAAKAAVVAAAAELCLRFKIEKGAGKDMIRCERDIIDIFQPLLANLPHEEFWAIFMTISGAIIDRTKLGQGGTNSVIVDYKLVVKRGVDKLAHAVVIVHNHPSGMAMPSEGDDELTEKLSKAFSLFDIKLLDHVIITHKECFSYRESGFFDSIKSF